MIIFHTEDIDFELPDEDATAAWLTNIVKTEGGELSELNYIFCSDEYLHKINVEYLDHDTYTDIITFPMDDEKIEGDIFVSIERVRENAKTHEATFEQELRRVLAHGVLHLLGYGDKTEAEATLMRQKEEEYM